MAVMASEIRELRKMEFGSNHRCTITGFVGAVTARAEYVNSAPQVLLQPPVGPDGVWREAVWFAAGQVAPLSAES